MVDKSNTVLYNESATAVTHKTGGDFLKDRVRMTLQESERKIMEGVWDRAPIGVVGIWNAIEETTGWSKSTVNTLLMRMLDKGLVRYEEGKKSREYYPCYGREDVAIGETRSLLDRVYSGSVGLMMSTLVDNRQLTREEIDELYVILKRAEEGSEND